MASSGPSASDSTSSAQRPLEDLSMSVKGSSPKAPPSKDSELQLAVFVSPESWLAPPPAQDLSHQLKSNPSTALCHGEGSDRKELTDPGKSLKCPPSQFNEGSPNLSAPSASKSGPVPSCEPSCPVDFASEESDPEGSHPCARFAAPPPSEQPDPPARATPDPPALEENFSSELSWDANFFDRDPQYAAAPQAPPRQP